MGRSLGELEVMCLLLYVLVHGVWLSLWDLLLGLTWPWLSTVQCVGVVCLLKAMGLRDKWDQGFLPGE